METYLNFGLRTTNYTLAETGVQEIIHSNITFDLVIVEQFMNEAHLGFAQHFKAPLIVFSSVGYLKSINDMVGNPTIPSYVPHSFSGFSTKMNFYQRLENTILSIFDWLLKELLVFPEHDKLLKQYFPNASDLKDVIHNISLVLLNSYSGITDPVPVLPNMIEIAGFHIEPSENLPRRLNKFLDLAKEGVIIFNMESYLKEKELTSEILDIFSGVFSEFKGNVLWKFENENIRGIPKNVITSKWLPQRAVLASYNLILIIPEIKRLISLRTPKHEGFNFSV